MFVVTALLFAVAYGENGNGVSAPVFSAEAGFYSEPFYLSISCSEGETVWYTLDCSDPRISDTAICCSGPVYICNNTRDTNIWSAKRNISLYGQFLPNGAVQKGMVIRCICRNKEGECGEEVINTYFVNKNRPYYSAMGVISLVTDGENLFDPDTGIYVIGNSYATWRESDQYEDFGDLGSEKSMQL
ncbi:MAG: hypothetical protein CW338_06070 [Clostridiales bacterium]|nr:hypothetical protein [Clostridiales bacterium]